MNFFLADQGTDWRLSETFEDMATARRSAFWLLLAALAALTTPAEAALPESQAQIREWLAAGAVAALSDPDDEVKGLALLRLGELAQPDTAEAIAAFLADGRSVTERSRALRAYAKLHVRDQRHRGEVEEFLCPPPPRSAPGGPPPSPCDPPDPDLAEPAAEALAAMGAIDAEVRPRLVELLECRALLPRARGSGEAALPDHRCALATSVMRGLAAGGALRGFRPQVVALLHEPPARSAALRAIESAGLASEYLAEVRSILGDGTEPRSGEDSAAALSAVTAAGEGRDHVSQIEWALRQRDDFELMAAGVRAIERSDLDRQYQARLRLALAETDDLTRYAVVTGIASSGGLQTYAEPILNAMAMPAGGQPLVHRAGLTALETLARTGGSIFRRMFVAALSPRGDPDAAAAVIRGLADAGTIGQYRTEITQLLGQDPPYALSPLLLAFRAQPCSLNEQVLLASSLDSYLQDLASYKATIYSCSGGGAAAKLVMSLIPRVGQRTGDAIPREDDRRLAFQALSRLAAAAPHATRRSAYDRRALAHDTIAWALADLAELIDWNTGDLTLLRATRQTLAADSPAPAEALARSIDVVERRQWPLRLASKVWAIAWRPAAVLLLHAAILTILILFYPRNLAAQALFNFNPWVRRILLLGYFEAALLLVPCLRRRLMHPLLEPLLAGAAPSPEEQRTYYPGSMVLGPDGKVDPLTDRLSVPLRGQVILQGEPGVGKTLSLKRMASSTPAIAVFLTAASCSRGVIEAVRDRFDRVVGKDAWVGAESYVTSLIWIGAMEIYIDDLEAAPEDARVRIQEFMADHPKAMVVVAATEPPAAGPGNLYRLLPLEESAIPRFLECRYADRPQAERERILASFAQYKEAELDATSPNVHKAKLRALTNPGSLRQIADAIALGQTPHLEDWFSDPYHPG